MECLDDLALAAFVEGALTVAARAEAERHLDRCPSCLTLVATVARAGVGGVELGTRPRAEGDDERRDDGFARDTRDGEPRYVVGEEIARGGMGRIVAAEDRRLGRRVALKLVRRPSLEVEARFQREIAITARLQHPAIVPVYDAGVLPDGEPFYAMRMVSGRGLDRAAADARSLEERLALLPAVMGVVDAIAYAHGEGVVHRDLKPQNVLVGPFGETVVLDWGLAKELAPGTVDEDGAANRSLPEERDASDGTRDGDVLGTLAYMAPEQAAGRAAADERTDVYGLGAILYHVLAGVPPHVGRSDSLSTQSVRDVPEPIAVRVPGVPRDLTAIVERAMAFEPDRRYPSARELAEDLRRFLAGGLVRAHQYSPLQLIRRFVARHKAAFSVASTATVVVAVLLALGLARIFAERSRAEAARVRAEAAQAQSDVQRGAAEKLVDFVLGDLHDRLERIGKLDALRGVGHEVEDYYARVQPRIGAAGGDDQLRRARALRIVAGVASDAGDTATAERVAREALAAVDAATASGPGADEIRCGIELDLGKTLEVQGDLDGARSVIAACATRAAARAGAGDARVWNRFVVRADIDLASVASARGDRAAARSLLVQARDLGHGLGSDDDEDARLVINASHDLAELLYQQGAQDEARAAAAAALEIARQVAGRHPEAPEARRALAVALTQQGRIERARGDLAAAERAFGESRTISRALVEHDPENMTWLRDVEVAADNLGNVALARGDLAGALPYLRESQEIAERQRQRDPSNAQWLEDTAISALTIGDVLDSLGKGAESEASLRAAVASFEQLVELTKHGGDAEHELAMALGHLANTEGAHHELAAAGKDAARSLELRRQLFAREDVPRTRREVAEALLLLAELARSSGELAVARRQLVEAREVIAPIRGNAASDVEVATTVGELDKAWQRIGER